MGSCYPAVSQEARGGGCARWGWCCVVGLVFVFVFWFCARVFVSRKGFVLLFSLFLLGVFLAVFVLAALCFVGAFCFLVGFFVCGSNG